MVFLRSGNRPSIAWLNILEEGWKDSFRTLNIPHQANGQRSYKFTCAPSWQSNPVHRYFSLIRSRNQCIVVK